MRTLATEDYILLYGSHLWVEWLDGARMCDKKCGETGQTVQVIAE